MDIAKKNNRSRAGAFFKKYFNKKIVFGSLIVGLIVSCFLGSKFIRTKGYNGLFDFASTVFSNYKSSLNANPEKISIEISNKDFKKLEKNRQQALERGVIINDIDGDYVSGTIEYKGKKISVKLRLKGHMTDHLQDNKWSFRIKVKEKDEMFMGMKRFSIQHPGTRGYIYEWIYHELMKREDVIALRYKFINVSVNGRDWGIYAVEENFENELLENNKRLKGPILRFNPDLYWVKRYNDLEHTSSVDEFASYYSANPEAYREDKVLSDSVQKQYYLKAIGLIEGLRSRKISVEDAFDIPRLAKFHAIIDLVGGIHSIDWSDIKYYYDPVASKLEPVAYESFTVLQSRELSSQYKFVSIDSAHNFEDWHSMIFSNKYFFRTYIKELERISRPEYLDSFFDETNEDLKANLAIINKEFPYKKFDKADYYKRQNIIRKILSAPKSIHAYYKETQKNSVVIQIGAIDALPVEIRSVTINSLTLKPESSLIIPSKQNDEYVSFKDYKFISDHELSLNEAGRDSIKINYSVPGSSEIMQCRVFSFPHTDSEFISNDLKNKNGNLQSFPFLLVDEKNKIIEIRSGNHVISFDMIIPSGYKMVASGNVALDLKEHAKIISYSPLFFNGNEEGRIIIGSSDSTGQGIELIHTALKSEFNYVNFTDLPEVNDAQWKRSGYLTFYESPVEFKNCNFYNCKAGDVINIIRSEFTMDLCLFQKMSGNALNCDFSNGKISDCVFEFCNKNAITISMGTLDIKNIYVSHAGRKAICLKSGGQIKGSKVQIKNSNVGIVAENSSKIELHDVKIFDSEFGVVAFRDRSSDGQPQVNITGLEFTNVKRNYLREKNSIIIVNGLNVGEVAGNVKEIIKGDKNK